MKGRSNRLQLHLLGREQSLLLVGNSAASSSSACGTISCSAAEQSRNIMATPCCSPENGQGKWMTASRSLSFVATNTGRGLLSRSRPALVNPYHGDKPEWMTDVSHPITMVSPKFLRMWQPKSLLRGNLFRRPPPDLLDSRYAKRALMVKASPGRLLKLYEVYDRKSDCVDSRFLVRVFCVLGQSVAHPNAFFATADRQRIVAHAHFKRLCADIASRKHEIRAKEVPQLLFSMAILEYRFWQIGEMLLLSVENNLEKYRFETLATVIYSLASLNVGTYGGGGRENERNVNVIKESTSQSWFGPEEMAPETGESPGMGKATAKNFAGLFERCVAEIAKFLPQDEFGRLPSASEATFKSGMRTGQDVDASSFVSEEEAQFWGQVMWSCVMVQHWDRNLPLFMQAACAGVRDREHLDACGWLGYYIYQTLYCCDVLQPRQPSRSVKEVLSYQLRAFPGAVEETPEMTERRNAGRRRRKWGRRTKRSAAASSECASSGATTLEAEDEIFGDHQSGVDREARGPSSSMSEDGVANAEVVNAEGASSKLALDGANVDDQNDEAKSSKTSTRSPSEMNKSSGASSFSARVDVDDAGGSSDNNSSSSVNLDEAASAEDPEDEEDLQRNIEIETKRMCPMWMQERLHEFWLDGTLLKAQPQGSDELQLDVERALNRTRTQASINTSVGRQTDDQHCFFAGHLLKPNIAIEYNASSPLGPNRPHPTGFLHLKQQMFAKFGVRTATIHRIFWERLSDDEKDEQILRLRAQMGYVHVRKMDGREIVQAPEGKNSTTSQEHGLLLPGAPENDPNRPGAIKKTDGRARFTQDKPTRKGYRPKERKKLK